MPESTGTRYEWIDENIWFYIDSFSQSSGKHATFSPSTNIQIGDYGAIDVATNEFERRGNIFQDDEILRSIPELATDDVWKPQTTSEEDKLVITDYMKMTDLGPSEDAELRLRFKGSGRFLVMYRPRTVDIVQPIDLTKLRKIQKLEGMHLVTGVVTCSSYALFYYSNASTINISLSHSSPHISANGPVKQGWTWDVDGIYKDGYNPEGDHEYTPLFSLTESISCEPSDGKDASDKTVPLVDPIKLRPPIPPPSAGDGNEIFKSGEIGVAPWLSGKSKRPEKWKSRPAAPSDPEGNKGNHRDSIRMHNFSAPERDPPSTTAINPSTRSNLKASGAADHSRYYDFDRISEDDSNGCFPSWCCCK